MADEDKHVVQTIGKIGNPLKIEPAQGGTPHSTNCTDAEDEVGKGNCVIKTSIDGRNQISEAHDKLDLETNSGGRIVITSSRPSSALNANWAE